MSLPAGALALTREELQRASLVDLLLARGERGIAGLIAMLDDPSWTVRRAVVAALSSAGPLATSALLETLTSRRDHEARVAAAVDALSALTGDSEIEARLASMVRHPDPAVVADVAQVLGRRRSTAGVPALAELARHADDNVAVAAIESLGRIGGRAAVDQLVAAVRSGNFFRTFPAIDVLGRSGDPRAVAPLSALLEQPQYLAEAARALGRTGDRAAIAPLGRLLGQQVAVVRVAALALKDLQQRHQARYGNPDVIEQALGRPGSAAMVRQLLRALPEGDADEQAAICFLLGVQRDPSAAPSLALLLDRPAPVGPAAAAAIKRLGPRADAEILRGIGSKDSLEKRTLLPLVSFPRAMPDVVSCLGDPDPDVRVAACEALARIGAPGVVGDLFGLLSDPNPRVSFSAVAAIQSLGSPQTEALALSAAGSTDATIRRAAMRILAYFGFRSALDVFLRALGDPDPKVREAGLQGLPFVEDPRAVDALCVAARALDERTRAIAMRAFGQCAGELRINACLLKGLEDPDAWVRYYACQSLGRVSFEPAAQAVIHLLHDPAGQVRVAAVEALSRFKSPLALDALKAATLDEDPDIQRAALVGLGVARDRDSLPVMLAATASEDPATRLVALSAISGFASPEVLSALARAAHDPSENVRTAAIGFLAAVPGAAATQLLAGLLRDAAPAYSAQPHAPTLDAAEHDSAGRASMRPDAIVTALATHNEGRIPGLLAALETADDETAPELAAALARQRRPESLAALVALMTMPNLPARKAAAVTLAGLSTREALDVVATAAINDPDPEIRQICALLAR